MDAGGRVMQRTIAGATIQLIIKHKCLECIEQLGVGVPTARKGEIDTDLPLASPTVPYSAKTEIITFAVIDS